MRNPFRNIKTSLNDAADILITLAAVSVVLFLAFIAAVYLTVALVIMSLIFLISQFVGDGVKVTMDGKTVGHFTRFKFKKKKD
jgi:hypothetical protein